MKKLIEKLLLIVLISCLFFPSVQVFGSFSLRLEDVIILTLLGLVFLPFVLSKAPVFKTNGYLRLYILVLLAILFSCFFGYIFLLVPFSGGDWNEYIRMLKPLILIFLLLHLDPDSLVKDMEKVLKWGSIYIICLGFFQYFNFLGIGQLLSGLYGVEHHLESSAGLELGRQRIVLTGSGPNDGAVIALFLVVYNLFRYLSSRQTLYLIITLGLLLCILFTSSRTVLLCSLVICGVTLYKHGVWYIKIGFVVISIATVIYILPHFIYIYEGFQMAWSGDNNSLLRRFDKWGEAYELFKRSPWIGWGIAKSIHETVVDGEYFLLLRRFGIIGTILILLFVFYPIFAKVRNQNYLLLIAKYVSFAAAIIMITNNFFNSYQIITAHVLFSAIALQLNKSHEYKNLPFNNSSY